MLGLSCTHAPQGPAVPLAACSPMPQESAQPIRARLGSPRLTAVLLPACPALPAACPLQVPLHHAGLAAHLLHRLALPRPGARRAGAPAGTLRVCVCGGGGYHCQPAALLLIRSCQSPCTCICRCTTTLALRPASRVGPPNPPGVPPAAHRGHRCVGDRGPLCRRADRARRPGGHRAQDGAVSGLPGPCCLPAGCQHVGGRASVCG